MRINRNTKLRLEKFDLTTRLSNYFQLSGLTPSSLWATKKGSGYHAGLNTKLIPLGSLVISFALGCRVTSLNLSISVSLIAAMMKIVPRFRAIGGTEVEYWVIARKPHPLFPSSFRQLTKFLLRRSCVSSSTTSSLKVLVSVHPEALS